MLDLKYVLMKIRLKFFGLEHRLDLDLMKIIYTREMKIKKMTDWNFF